MSPDEMREVANRVRSRNPRPSMQDTIPTHATLTAVHAMADAFEELAEAIDPTPREKPVRKPFDLEGARARLAASRANIDSLKGQAA